MVKEEYNPQEGWTKGGGLKGPPKRWTGKGPPPARHIPWPEIFKHHLSVVEGHLKMIEMIRKHTVEGSGNWRTLTTMIDRAKEMLQMSKQATRSFVPPAKLLDKIPIGSSSLSMYPGYSPADHEYGEAAQQFGQEWAEAKRKGFEFKPEADGPQYEIGQSKKRKKKSLEETKANLAELEAFRGHISKSGESSDGVAPGNQTTPVNESEGSSQPPKDRTGEEAWKARAAMSARPILQPQGSKKQQKANDKRPRSKPASGESARSSAKSPEGSANAKPAFFIDSNPTPVNLANMPPSPYLKRAASDEHGNQTFIGDASVAKPKKSKKAKVDHEYAEPAALAGDADVIESSATAALPTGSSVSHKEKPRIEFEDITAEVDARMAEREERRKRKSEKKRKREPGAEGDGTPSAASTDSGPQAELGEGAQAARKKSTRKKAKKNALLEGNMASGKEDAEATTLVSTGEKTKKRKASSSGEGQGVVGERQKKKTKKGKGESSA